MDTREPSDSDIEKELDTLYRKVADLDPEEDKKNLSLEQGERNISASAEAQKPTELAFQRKKRRRWAMLRIGLGLAITLLVLGAMGVFYWRGASDHRTSSSEVTLHLTQTDRPPGEGPSAKAKELPHVPGGTAKTLSAEAAKDQTVKPPAAEAIQSQTTAPASESPKDQAVVIPPAGDAKGKAVIPPATVKPKGRVAAHPPAEKKAKTQKTKTAAASHKEPQKKYALQLRAFPQDQKQKATAFLKDLQKRSFDVSLETVPIPSRGTWHRILLGHFSTRKEAADFKKRDPLARAHPDSFIQKRTHP
jgi:flagellar basal body-associated protein FliL